MLTIKDTSLSLESMQGKVKKWLFFLDAAQDINYEFSN